MNQKIKKILKYPFFTIVGIGFLIVLINFYVYKSGGKHIFEDMDEVPEAQVALVLGAMVHPSGQMSDVLGDRVVAAYELYKNKKVKKFLVSGDHGQEEYDEVNAVKQALLDMGVKKEDIFLDHAGFDTYDSLYRAREVFEVDSLIIVTQKFHLPRAVYIGRALGMEAYGYVADKQEYVFAEYYKYREYLARIKAFLNVFFHSKPTFLGEAFPIYGDGTKTWD